MLALVLTKIKVWWKVLVGAVVVMVPVITYLFGRKDGASSQKVEYLQDSITAEKYKADFYSSMGDAIHEAQTNRPMDRDSVVERLRKHGL